MEILVLCIGNPDGGDDSVGPYIAEKLQKQKNLTVLNCETYPENYTGVVKKHNPKNLIIIDAVDMGLEPGEIRIVPKEKIGVMTISTHGMPISLLIEYLNQYVDNILLIGIQPKTMNGKLTNVVKDSTDKLVKILKNKKLEQIKILT